MKPDSVSNGINQPDLPFDAMVTLARGDQGEQAACVFVKYTYVFKHDGNVERADPEPLYNNLFDPGEGLCLLPGCDFWPYKPATDVVVQGRAHAPDGRPVPEISVSVVVNDVSRYAQVMGKRVVSCRGNGSIERFPRPEPFESMALTWENAYGGIDLRVPVGKVDSKGQVLKLVHDHPGLYPRNPFGKGYVVMPAREGIDGIELPNVEHPSDLLTPERLIAGAPENWHLQPLPACFDWLRGHMYPRCVFFGGAEAWYPGPDDVIAEVRLGYLPKNYRSQLQHREPDDLIDPRFCNEAPVGMIFPYLKGDEWIRLTGMHPEGDIRFELPGSPPDVSIFVDTEKSIVRPVLHTLLIKPEDGCFSMLWRASQPLSKPFIVKGPGREKDLPIEFAVGLHKRRHISEPAPYWARARDAQKAETAARMEPWYNIFDLPEE